MAASRTTIGSGSGIIAISVAEDAYQGDAQLTISVDGVQVGGVQTATTLRSSGTTQQFDVAGTYLPGLHTVSVNFLNDAYDGTASTDRNLYVTQATFNGAAINGSALSLASAGVQSFSFRVPDDAPTPPASASTPGFHVAIGGNDGNNGSAASPFASLARAVAEMERSSTVRTTYLHGGSYGLSSTLALSSTASGFTIKGYDEQRPVIYGMNGLQTLVSLNGTTSVAIEGISFQGGGRGGAAMELRGANNSMIAGNQFKDAGTALSLDHSSNNTVSGNQINNSVKIGIELKDRSDANLIDSNLIDGIAAPSTEGGAIFAHGVDNNIVSHNLIKNTAGAGISFENWDELATINVGNTVSWNKVYNTGYGTAYDTGSIYVLGRAEVDTKMTISNNYIDGTGAGGNAHTVAIYLDDGTSGTMVSNNIARNVGSHGFQIHGGHDNTLTNNIFDLDGTTNSAGFFQALTADLQGRMYGNNVHQNIIQANKPIQIAYDNMYGGAFSVESNLYYSVVGGQIKMDSNATDYSAKYGNPRFADVPDGNYGLLSGSAATQIGFKAIEQSSMGLNSTTAHWYS